MKAKILEIFQSIQGEGKYAGASHVFVRFFECNMHCVWCDTPHSIGDTTRHYKEYDVSQVIEQIESLGGRAHAVSLTGGEPLLQAAFIQALLPQLKKNKRLSYLETNGTLPRELNEIIGGIDMIAMDIKLPSSTKCRAFWDEHKEFIKIGRAKDFFIKTVVSSETEKQDMLRSIELVAGIDPNILFIIQPNTYDLSNGVMKKCLDYYNDCTKHLTQVRIIPQMHKFMKLR